MNTATITATEIAELNDITKQAVMKRATKEKWPYKNGGNRTKRFKIAALPVDIQKALAEKGDISPTLIPCLAPEAAIVAATRELETPIIKDALSASSEAWTDETAITMKTLRNPKVTKWARIIQEAEQIPPGVKRTDHVKTVAKRHKTTFQTIYKKIKIYKRRGLVGLEHRHKNRGAPRKWDPEALDWWIGLCLKREHRKMSKDVLYDVLVAEAANRSWSIGGYESALQWYKKKATPQLLAYQRGGYRALDNTLPPILRNYSDLQPFEILVGDQHRFDFWVTDDDTGEVFRPEGYFWQDLRTRCFYGGAIDKKYDSYLIGLALRMGIKAVGAFSSIYTDHGKPELSRYIMGVMKDMRDLGLHVKQTVDAPLETPKNAELVNPCVIDPGTHRKAIVRNAKAKMIEGSFSVVEGILRDEFRVPGYVKILGGSGEENDVDQKEIEALARAGKLLTFWEFVRIVFEALDYYNKEKIHRGVLKEWGWKPKPKSATPMDCLRMCHADGWRPGKISQEAVDLIFLPRARRAVDRGRIEFRREWYEADALVTVPRGERVEVRFDPMALDKLIVFRDGEYLCNAYPTEYSSMKDMDLASRKIAEKSRRRKGFILEYSAFTSEIPDIRTYSQTPAIEKAAPLVTKADKNRLKEQNEVFVQTPEEIEAEIARIEERSKRQRPVWSTASDRYAWCLETQIRGDELLDTDMEFMSQYESEMTEGGREYWNVYRETVTKSAAQGGAS